MNSSSSVISSTLGLKPGYRPRQYAAIWHSAIEEWKDQLALALERSSTAHTPTVFFRADDIGAGGCAFETLCSLFRNYDIPIGMAVVPAWLSDVRRNQLFQAAPLDEPLWGWHQHGWRHVNWQRAGKKSEFDEQRPFEKQWRDIQQGQQKMQAIFGDRFLQVFTPPWNRLSQSTIKILHELHFKGVSMAGPLPRGLKPSMTLRNLRVQLDLHTRKAKDGVQDYEALLHFLSSHLGKREPLGIMIHHHRMTYFAFEFLEELLSLLKYHLKAHFLSFQDILEKTDAT